MALQAQLARSRGDGGLLRRNSYEAFRAIPAHHVHVAFRDIAHDRTPKRLAFNPVIAAPHLHLLIAPTRR
jgi:hypothetical protein